MRRLLMVVAFLSFVIPQPVWADSLSISGPYVWGTPVLTASNPAFLNGFSYSAFATGPFPVPNYISYDTQAALYFALPNFSVGAGQTGTVTMLIALSIPDLFLGGQNLGPQASAFFDFGATTTGNGSVFVSWSLSDANGASSADFANSFGSLSCPPVFPNFPFLPCTQGGSLVIPATHDVILSATFTLYGGDGTASLTSGRFVTPVPEPTTLLLVGTGIAGLWLKRRNR